MKLERRRKAWQGAAMANRSPAAGGCFLVLAIFLGFGIGAATGRPVEGTLIGTLAGVVVALAMWLRDRAKTNL